MSRKVSLDLERAPVGLGLRKVGQWVGYADFTDGASTAGTLALSKTIPAGSLVIGSKATVVEGFTGDTSAVLDVGDGSDADKFSLATLNVFAVANNLIIGTDEAASGAGGGLAAVTSDATVTLTVTAGSDWGDVTAGKMYVEVFYFSTNPEIIDQVATRYDG